MPVYLQKPLFSNLQAADGENVMQSVGPRYMIAPKGDCTQPVVLDQRVPSFQPRMDLVISKQIKYELLFDCIPVATRHLYITPIAVRVNKHQ